VEFVAKEYRLAKLLSFAFTCHFCGDAQIGPIGPWLEEVLGAGVLGARDAQSAAPNT